MTNPFCWAIIIALKRSWRNWQTRKTKDLVGNSMQVQSLSTAPKIAELLAEYRYFFVVDRLQEAHNYMQVHARNTATHNAYFPQASPVFRRPAL